MSNPYVGEIRMFGGNFAPDGWMFCNGALLSIAENETLFVLIGTTYGGDGVNTFALPNLSSRVPVHAGNGYVTGQTGGAESVTLAPAQTPLHSHALMASSAVASVGSPGGAVLAATTANSYGSGAPSTPMGAGAIGTTGGAAQAHNNMAPYATVNFIISLYGIFPSQN
jgi:microcystin-dependent protein